MSMATSIAGHVRHAGFALDQRVRDSNRALWLATAFPLLVLYLFSLRVQPHEMSIDAVSVTSSGWQLAHHGTPRLPADGGYYPAWMIPSGPGHVISNREPGLIFLAAFFYRVLPWTSIYNVSPASLAAALVTAAAMGTLALVLRRVAGARTAWIGALLAGVGTSTWAVSGTALWPHGPDELYLAAAMLALAAGRNVPAGVAFALAVLTRPPLALVAAVTGIWAAITRRTVRPALVIGILTACGLAAFLAYSHEFWGGGLQSQYTAADGGDFQGHFLAIGPSGMGHFLLNVVGTLISPQRGIFVGSPFLLALIPGLRQAWHEAPAWVRSSAVGGLFYMAVQLKANRFSGGNVFWGYRYPIEMLTLLAPLLVLAWRTYTATTARRRAWFWCLATVSVTMQVVGNFCFRYPIRVSDWAPADLVSAVQQSPAGTAVVCFVGYFTAAVVYRKISTSETPSQPNADQPTPVKAEATSALG